MTELDTLRADVLGLYDGLADGQVGDVGRRLLDDSRKRLASGRYTLVICGEFRRGKSSLLNALVERPRLFPVDVDVTTSAVAILRWDERERAAVHFAAPDGPRPAPLVIPLDEVKEYVTEQRNPDNERNVDAIEMTAPIERLRSGLVLVDTPGVGSLNPGHTAATRAYLPNADAVLFVASAVEPLTTVELNVLAAALEQNPVVITAITKIDQIVDPAPVVAQARERIAKESGLDADALVIVPVSSARKRDAIEDDDEELLAESGFPALEREIWGGLAATCGAAQIHRALDALEAAVAEAVAPVLNELAALRDDDTLARVDAELRDAQQTATELKASGARWRDELKTDVDHLSRPIRDQLMADFEDVKRTFRDRLDEPIALTDPNQVVREATDGAVDAANRANQALAAVVAECAVRYTEHTRMNLVADGVDARLIAPVAGEVAALGDRAGTGGKFGRFRTTWSGGIAGGAAGAVLGTVLGAFVPILGHGVGFLLGGLFGQIAGLFGGNQQAREREEERRRKAHLSSLKDRVIPTLDAGRRSAERAFKDQVTDYTNRLTRALADQVGAQSDSIADSVKRLAETRQRTAQQRQARIRVLREQETGFQRLAADLAAARKRALALASK